MCLWSCHFLTEISMSHSEKKKHDWKVLIEIKYLHTIGTWHLPELCILLKLKCNSQFCRLHLICRIWCFHWSCPMTCSVHFGKLVLSSTVVFQHASSWGCQVHFESWQSFLYIAQVLLKAALRGPFLAPPSATLWHRWREALYCRGHYGLLSLLALLETKIKNVVLGHSQGQ